ncbi:unnamed protein product [Adineta steineri]|uniref:NAD(P)(+)--arginine ADP-ribosyltransferase n=1 Tax=Adineta steineri TaxID=433720 RepID=A0A815QR67_9BILA|nr:unnamed protein product [Adineta steineri]CAF1466831.1 unnamed protein product [Adineta steineri]
MNLRSEDRSILKDWFLYLKLIITGLAKIPSFSRNLYRGVRMNLATKYQNGETVIWWAFSSCTTTKEVLKQDAFCGSKGERTIFEINCYSGKDVREYSKFPSESEVLLIAATQFRVVSNVNKGDGLIVIQLEETEPKYPLIEKGAIQNFSSPIAQSQKLSTPGKRLVHVPKTKQPIDIPLDSVFDESSRNPEIVRQINRTQFRSKVVIEGQRLNKEDMRDVVEKVIIKKQCPQIQIRNAEMTIESISELGRGIRESTTVNEVDLCGSRLSSNDISHLVGELSIPQTHTVEQWKCCGLTRMKTLDGGPLKVLSLAKNNIDDDGVKHIVGLLRLKRTLTELYLNDNQIGDAGVEKLATALSHPAAVLQKLYLQDNKRITDRSVKSLTEMFEKSQSLNTLWLLNCGLTDNGKQELSEAAGLKRGFYLNIERFAY